MRIFGITGGSGSGKSTVSAMLAKLGVEIIDTDKIAREVVKKGSACLDELRQEFGDEIILENGKLDRKKLAGIAFSSAEKTELLSKITHRYIMLETEERIKKSSAELIGIDGAVIIGSPVERLCEKLVLVTADRDTRIERIKTRDHLTDSEAENRLNAQPSEEFYRNHCDYIINNSFDTEYLFSEVQKLYNKLKGV